MFIILTRVSETVSFPSPDKTVGGYYALKGKCYTPPRNQLILTWAKGPVETEGGISTLFRYASVKQVHWMFKGWIERAVKSPEEEIIRTKRAHFDRLEGGIERRRGRA